MTMSENVAVWLLATDLRNPDVPPRLARFPRVAISGNL